MATNLETKNNLERDEVKEELNDLKKEVKEPIDKRVYLEVDSAFKKFTKETQASNVRLEKLRDGKLRLKTYGQTCEFDLKSRGIAFIKGGSTTNMTDISTDRISTRRGLLDEKNLLRVFKQMDMYNKAISIKKTSK